MTVPLLLSPVPALRRDWPPSLHLLLGEAAGDVWTTVLDAAGGRLRGLRVTSAGLQPDGAAVVQYAAEVGWDDGREVVPAVPAVPAVVLVVIRVIVRQGRRRDDMRGTGSGTRTGTGVGGAGAGGCGSGCGDEPGTSTIRMGSGRESRSLAAGRRATQLATTTATSAAAARSDSRAACRRSRVRTPARSPSRCTRR
ncbi:hypothetical protein [Geodermatophilus africanus]|uniref:hypothetical protein n=1 Tax=Geodermatophilus africanus TaxID=1137993 RepID=UPI000B819FDB|nr:hypothetical protein [Geodermatophilus africanus]